jgi:hypothetical protein
MSLHCSEQDDALLRARRQGIAEASTHADDIAQRLRWREPELLPEFTRHYQQLMSLSRQVRRRLQRQWRRSLAGIALLLALGMQPAVSATVNVGGACTLARAIRSANSDTAVGGCTAGSGADRILLPAGTTQTLTTVNNTVYGATGLPVIRSVITIAGNNSTIRRASSAPEFRIITVGSHGNLTLQDTTVRGGTLLDGDVNGGGVANYGRLTITNGTISGNSTGGNGGGVYSGATMTLTNSTISGNAAYGGGGIRNSGTLSITSSTISGNTAAASGGGVSSGITLAVANSTISGNAAGFAGGGVDSAGDITVTNSTISGNTAGDRGGGLANLYRATIIRSTISGNTAGDRGGGVTNRVYGTMTVTNSTISGNSTSGTGSYGGGVANYDGTMTLINSTITRNRSGERGGGVHNRGVYREARVTVTNSTISGNLSGSGGGVFNNRNSQLDLNRTLISGNTAQGAGSELYNYSDEFFPGSVTAANFNLFGHSGLTNARAFQNFTPGATDITATSNGNTPTKLSNVLNTTLADNGGPTKTHKIGLVSPALDAVTNVHTCPPPRRDQRGVRRPQDGNGDGGIACDIGSFERRP